MWTHRSDRGIAEFEEAIKFNPSFAAAHVLLGQMYLYARQREEAIERVEKGIRLSPSDSRLFIWLPALAGAHYQMRHYEKAIAAGRRSWSLNRNWPHGLRYVVAGLAQLGRIEEAQAALSDLQLTDANLEFSASMLRRTCLIRLTSIIFWTACARPGCRRSEVVTPALAPIPDPAG
jgi:tetratricopeptide (TPR) repeat protein